MCTKILTDIMVKQIFDFIRNEKNSMIQLSFSFSSQIRIDPEQSSSSTKEFWKGNKKTRTLVRWKQSTKTKRWNSLATQSDYSTARDVRLNHHIAWKHHLTGTRRIDMSLLWVVGTNSKQLARDQILQNIRNSHRPRRTSWYDWSVVTRATVVREMMY